MKKVLRALKRAGVPPWIVSGSLYWLVVAGLRAMGEDHLVEGVIGLRLKVKEGVLQAEFDGPEPWGQGKVTAIKERISKHRRPAIAIGNSGEGDGPMLAYARDLRVAIHPDDTLRQIADLTRTPSTRGRFGLSRARLRQRLRKASGAARVPSPEEDY